MWKSYLRRSFNRVHGNKSSVVFSFFKFNNAVSKCKQSEIFSNANVFSRMVNRATLANDDVTGDDWLSTKNFYTKALTLRVATVLYTAFTLFMCHDNFFKIPQFKFQFSNGIWGL